MCSTSLERALGHAKVEELFCTSLQDVWGWHHIGVPGVLFWFGFFSWALCLTSRDRQVKGEQQHRLTWLRKITEKQEGQWQKWKMKHLGVTWKFWENREWCWTFSWIEPVEKSVQFICYFQTSVCAIRPLLKPVINIDLKIIFKALAKHLEKVTPCLIHSDQTGFIQGRYVYTNVGRLINLIDYFSSENLKPTCYH